MCVGISDKPIHCAFRIIFFRTEEERRTTVTTESERPRDLGVAPTPWSPWSSVLPPCEQPVNREAPVVGGRTSFIYSAAIRYVADSLYTT
jgi:hypothetical protein